MGIIIFAWQYGVITVFIQAGETAALVRIEWDASLWTPKVGIGIALALALSGSLWICEFGL